MKILLEELKNWTDIDIAMHSLAKLTGLVEKDKSFFRDNKWMYWSDNSYGNTLNNYLMQLVNIGFLEYKEEDQKIRFNQSFQLENPSIN